MKKIIIAGGGHGGIAVAASLSKKGYNVTVYEKNTRENMGYDWTDIFNKDSLLAAKLPMPSKEKYTIKGDVSFYGPSENTKLVQRSPKNQNEIKMERRDIYNMLISHAEECGVNFCYEHKILGVIAENGRATGIKTDKGDFFGDLIIDACGCDSPVRKSLPYRFCIQKNMKSFEKFYVYRAFYNNPTGVKSDEEFKITLLSEGISGISWIMSEKEYTDVLIGRFEPFSLEEAHKSIEYSRSKNNNIGKELLRGGSFAYIPVRQPLAKMVADGYAAIGDSAFMTVPLIGSGIANALYASDMLYKAIINDKDQVFSAETLWEYETNYFKKIASICAPLACLKNVLAGITPDALDEVFDKGYLEAVKNIHFTQGKAFEAENCIVEIVIRLKNALNNKAVSSELLKSVKSMAKLLNIIKKMPEKYNENEVLLWTQAYNEIFN